MTKSAITLGPQACMVSEKNYDYEEEEMTANVGVLKLC